MHTTSNTAPDRLEAAYNDLSTAAERLMDQAFPDVPLADVAATVAQINDAHRRINDLTALTEHGGDPMTTMNEYGDLHVPDHLVPGIRAAASWAVVNAAQRLEPVTRHTGWGDFAADFEALEHAIAVLRHVGIGDEDNTLVNVDDIASLATAAASDARNDLAAMVEEGESARDIATYAAVVADHDEFAAEMTSLLSTGEAVA